MSFLINFHKAKKVEANANFEFTYILRITAIEIDASEQP